MGKALYELWARPYMSYGQGLNPLGRQQRAMIFLMRPWQGAAPTRITHEMVETMGGLQSQMYARFKSFAIEVSLGLRFACSVQSLS